MPLNNKINRFIINLPPLYPSGYPLDLGNIENQASRKGIFQNDKRAALKSGIAGRDPVKSQTRSHPVSHKNLHNLKHTSAVPIWAHNINLLTR